MKKIEYNFTQVDEDGYLNQKKNTRPTFNRDGLFYTPTFLNGSEKIPSLDEECFKMIHYEKLELEGYEIDSNNILRPKPSKRNRYCTLCKVKFQDYMKHLSNEDHQQKMKKSSFNDDIKELCQKIEKQNIEISKEKKIFKKNFKKILVVQSHSKSNKADKKNEKKNCFFS